MAKAMVWEDEALVPGTNSQWLKLEAGNNPIRVLTAPLSFTGKNFSGNLETQFAILVIDLKDQKIKIMRLAKSLANALRVFKDTNKIAPEDPKACSFTVVKTGAGKETRYTVANGMASYPIPAIVDVAKETKTFVEIIEKLEAKVREEGSIPPPPTGTPTSFELH